MSSNGGNQNKIQNNKPKNFYLKVINDYYNKLFQKVIEIYGIHEYKEKGQKCSFYQLTKVERKKFINYISDISNNNDDFKNITQDFLFDPDSNMTRENLVYAIEKEENGYYLQKAKFVWRITLLLIIIQYIYLVFLDTKYKCVDNIIQNKDEKFWYCKDKKCKVESIDFDLEKFFRVLYLIVFDAVYLINQFYFLRNFNRKKLGNYNAILYQCFEYLLLIFIYIYDFFEDKICVESRIKNIFYKKKVLSFDLILLFIDIIKFIIK